MSVDSLVMGGPWTRLGQPGVGLCLGAWGVRGFPSTTNEQTTHLASHGDCRMVMTTGGRIEKGRKEGERVSCIDRSLVVKTEMLKRKRKRRESRALSSSPATFALSTDRRVRASSQSGLGAFFPRKQAD